MVERELIRDELLNEEEIETDQYLLFNIDAQVFGIQAMRVQEISRMMDPTEVPNAPPYIDGIINLRGRLATVINFRRKFGYERKAFDDDTRIVIVEQQGFPVGIIVDAVSEVIKITEANVQNLPDSTTTTVSRTYLAGVGVVDNSLVILLDVDRMLDNIEELEVSEMKNAVDQAQSLSAQPLPEPPSQAAPGAARVRSKSRGAAKTGSKPTARRKNSPGRE